MKTILFRKSDNSCKTVAFYHPVGQSSMHVVRDSLHGKVEWKATWTTLIGGGKMSVEGDTLSQLNRRLAPYGTRVALARRSKQTSNG